MATVKTGAKGNAKNISKNITSSSHPNSRIRVQTIVKGPLHIKSPPAQRLVGVELNPGPPKSGKMKKMIRVSVAKHDKAKLTNLQRIESAKNRLRSIRGNNQRKSKQYNLTLSHGLTHGNKAAGVSMVTDGVNSGTIWKNTTPERFPFPLCREKIADITSTGTTFQTLLQLFVNPGNTILHPIFSQIAKNFEEFIPEVFRVYFRTEEYMASGNNVAAGLTAMGVNFDPDAANFADMKEIENYQSSISAAPFTGYYCLDVLEHRSHAAKNGRKGAGHPDTALNNYFVNYSPNLAAPSTSTPNKFYDVGNLQVCVNNTQAATIGEIWVEYKYTMIRRLQNPGAPSGGVIHFTSITATTASNFLAATQTGGTLGITLSATGQTITFPANAPGNYLVVETVAGATSASAIVVSSVTGGVAFLNVLAESAVRAAQSSVSSLSGTTTSPAEIITTVSVTAAGGTMIMSASTIVGTGTMNLFVVALPSTVVTVKSPVEQQLQLELSELRDQVSELKNYLLMAPHDSSSTTSIIRACESESDFEEEKEDPPGGSTSIDTLSRSTVDLMSALIKAKALTNRK